MPFSPQRGPSRSGNIALVVDGDDPLDEPPDGLSVGVISGGSADTADAIIQVGRRVKAARANHSADFGLNVVFMVPGKFLSPDFEGVRLGTVFTRKRAVIAQVAVPEAMGAPDLEPFVLNAVERAIDLAEERVAKRRLGWSAQGLRAALSDVRRS